MSGTKHVCPLCDKEHEGEVKVTKSLSARWEGPPPQARIVVADGARGMDRGE